jgi:DNA ligase-associated metallophosphoesterase
MPEKEIQSIYQIIDVAGQELWLLPEKAIFWKESAMLILTDLHLGKAGHFRKAGIPIPTSVHEADLLNLQSLIDTYAPEKILMLGDLFHSEINEEWSQFRNFLAQHHTLTFVLVKGNHDILPGDAYREPNLQVHEEEWICAPFHFTHHPPEKYPYQDLYNMSGHVHPGYRIRGKAGQHIKLPCFFFSPNGAVLPAFGKFTGCVHVPKKKHDRVYAIVPGPNQSAKVIQINH